MRLNGCGTIYGLPVDLVKTGGIDFVGTEAAVGVVNTDGINLEGTEEGIDLVGTNRELAT